MSAPYPPQILVIDDNAANLKVASTHLSEYAYVVLTARDGEAGFRRAQHTRPDLILLDILMPGVDGFETCRRLKAHPATKDIPVIFMTAKVEIQDKLQAFALGGVDYVTKPFEAPELLARVRTHLTLVQQRAQIAQHAQELEARVAAATAQLRQELEERRQVSEERARLQALVSLQSEQLYAQTRRWLEGQEDQNHGLAQRLRVDVSERIRLAVEALRRAQLPAQPAEDAIAQAITLLEPALAGSDTVSAELREREAQALTEDPLMRLSSREYEVFQLLAQGKPNKEIAYTLGVASSTVSTYRLRIFEKLGVEDVASLVRLALRFDRR